MVNQRTPLLLVACFALLVCSSCIGSGPKSELSTAIAPAKVTRTSASLAFELESVPTCVAHDDLRTRLEKIDAYVMGLKLEVVENPRRFDSKDWTDRVELVGADQLPDDFKFRNFSIQCWTSFEDARTSLSDYTQLESSGKSAPPVEKSGLLARSKASLRTWLSCAPAKDTNAKAVAAFATCLQAPIDTSSPSAESEEAKNQ